MLESFLTVGRQVIILMVLMSVGFILGKAKLITSQGSVSMSNIMMYIVVPGIMIASFQRELVTEHLVNFGMVLLGSTIIHIIAIGLSYVLIRDRNASRQGILRFAAVFANCGFMGYPLLTAMIGSMGVFYGSAAVIVMTVFSWTWGIIALQGEHADISWKPILCNPGVIGCIVALAFYLLQIKLPELISVPLDYISGLNTPLPMLIVGFQLSQADFKTALQGRLSYISGGFRLILMPLAAAFICVLLRVDSMVATVLIVTSATPAATLLSMLAGKYELDTSLASSMVSIQTAVSVVTMPIMIALAQTIAC